MRSNSIKRITIQKEINLLPESRLEDVKLFVETLLAQARIKKPEPVSLQGIWKNKGFEKISDLESEIANIRMIASNTLLDKKI